MAIDYYVEDVELQSLLAGESSIASDAQTIQNILSTKTNGIEGLPYQFPASVDRRITGTNVGRKYADKIFSRSPLLFLTPCEPYFMANFGDDDQTLVKDTLASLVAGRSVENPGFSFLTGQGRYYTTDFAYDDYYKYLNTMLTCVTAYMGIYNTEITIGNQTNQLGKINWQNELNSSFKTFFSSAENLVFYLDSFDSVSESFSNDTTESSLASLVNGFSDQMNEIRFLFGKEGDTMLSSTIEGMGDATSSIRGAVAKGLGKIGGGIVGSLATKGVDTVMEGGKIIFPEIWSNYDYSKSYNLEIKLRSPDNDPLSIFLNVLKPYCKLLALTVAREIPGNINAYRSPFLVRAYCKGKFSIDMGLITGLSVNKGGTGQWNDDGLPTQIDISIDIKDLYPKFAMSGTDSLVSPSSISDVVSNTAYMDFLANMSGLNVGQMEMGRRLKMAFQLWKATGSRIVGGVGTRLSQGISRKIGELFNVL